MMSGRAILHAFADEERPARALADMLAIPFAIISLHTFPDGELLPTVPDTAPTTIVYRSLARPNDKLIALMLAGDAWRRAGAHRLVLAAPYMCYLRQDAVFSPGQPNSQTVIGEILGSRFDRIITVDAHLHRIRTLSEVFPRAEAQDLCAAPLIARWLREHHPEVECIIGPDLESGNWVGQVAAALEVEHRLMSKVRRGDTDVRLTMDAPQHIKGRALALVDDVCASGGTLIQAIKILKSVGARTIVVCVTHALFDAGVERRLREAGASEIVSTDSVTHPTNAIALTELLAGALHTETRGQ